MRNRENLRSILNKRLISRTKTRYGTYFRWRKLKMKTEIIPYEAEVWLARATLPMKDILSIKRPLVLLGPHGRARIGFVKTKAH